MAPEDIDSYINDLKKNLGDVDIKQIKIDPENLEESLKKLTEDEEIASLFDLENDQFDSEISPD